MVQIDYSAIMASLESISILLKNHLQSDETYQELDKLIKDFKILNAVEGSKIAGAASLLKICEARLDGPLKDLKTMKEMKEETVNGLLDDVTTKVIQAAILLDMDTGIVERDSN